MRLILFLYLLSAIHLRVFAQGEHFFHYDSRSGLSQNSVTKVLRDHEGLYWFGTQDGLNFYDGYSFNVFRRSEKDSNSLCDNYILDLIDDGYGRIWIGTRNGLCYYEKMSGHVRRFQLTTSAAYSTYNEVKLFRLAGDTLSLYSGSTLFTAIKLGHGSPKLIPNTSPGNKSSVLGSTANGVYKYDSHGIIYVNHRRNTSVTVIDSVHAFISCKIYNEEFYIARGNEILVYDVKNGVPQQKSKYLFKSAVNDFCVDAIGNIWAGCTSGLVKVHIPTGTMKHFVHHAADPFSISEGPIILVSITNDNTLWIGINGAGVDRLNLNTTGFTTFSPLFFPQVRNNTNWTFFPFKNGLILPGENGFGWIPLDSSARPPQWLSAIQIINSPTTCLFAGDKLYIGTRESGLFAYDTATRALQKIELQGTLPHINRISHLMVSSTGKLWISTHDACFESDNSLKNFTMRYDGYIMHTMEDHVGNIWISSTNGLIKYHPSSRKQKMYTQVNGNTNSLSSRFCSYALEDPEGKIWVGTLGGGLNIFNPTDEKFKVLTTDDGLPNNVVYGLARDEDGNIWMSTNRGVSMYDISKSAFRNFSTDDGLNTNEFIVGSVYSASNGNIWFGSVQGPLRINTSEIDRNSFITQPVITFFKVNDLFFDRNPDSLITLGADQRNIYFRFTACDLNQQHKYSFQYMLAGFDTIWKSFLPSKQEVIYTNLPSGKYLIRLRAFMNGNPSEYSETTIRLIIAPYFWEELWFQIAVFAVLASVIIYLTRFFIRRRFRRRIELMEAQQKVHQERERISRELHDNVGSQLTFLISTLDYLSFQIDRNQTDTYQSLVKELSVNTRATNAQLRETIWALHQQSVSIESFTQKCRQYLSSVSSKGNNLNCEVNFNKSVQNVELNPMQALHLFRILQEAVNNAFKYANAKKLSVNITIDKDLVLSIEDDGVGFDASLNKSEHYGLKNIFTRAEEIFAKATIKSAPNEGTSVTVVVPLK